MFWWTRLRSDQHVSIFFFPLGTQKWNENPRVKKNSEGIFYLLPLITLSPTPYGQPGSSLFEGVNSTIFWKKKLSDLSKCFHDGHAPALQMIKMIISCHPQQWHPHTRALQKRLYFQPMCHKKQQPAGSKTRKQAEVWLRCSKGALWTRRPRSQMSTSQDVSDTHTKTDDQQLSDDLMI